MWTGKCPLSFSLLNKKTTIPLPLSAFASLCGAGRNLIIKYRRPLVSFPCIPSIWLILLGACYRLPSIPQVIHSKFLASCLKCSVSEHFSEGDKSVGVISTLQENTSSVMSQNLYIRSDANSRMAPQNDICVLFSPQSKICSLS